MDNEKQKAMELVLGYGHPYDIDDSEQEWAASNMYDYMKKQLDKYINFEAKYQLSKREEVWVRVWCAIMSRSSGLATSKWATEHADDCLRDFDKRFDDDKYTNYDTNMDE